MQYGDCEIPAFAAWRHPCEYRKDSKKEAALMAILTEAVLLEVLVAGVSTPLSECDSPTLNRLIHRGWAIIVPPRRGSDHISRVEVTESGFQHMARLKGL